MAEPVPYHVIETAAQEIHAANGEGNLATYDEGVFIPSQWYYLEPGARDRYRDMAEAAIEAAEPYLRRKARAELLEEISDELMAQVSDLRERTSVRNKLAWFGPEPFSPRLAHGLAVARAMYYRAKEERHGR